MRRTRWPRILGAFLVLVGVIASLAHVFIGAYRVPLWFCYLGPILAGIGLITRRPALLYGYVSVGLITQTPFVIDLTRVYLDLPQAFNLVRYDPFTFPLVARIGDMLVHFVALPAALVSVFHIEAPSRRTFYATYVIGFTAIMIASFVVGDVNCIGGGCLPWLAERSLVLYAAGLMITGLALPLVVFEGLRRLPTR